MKATLCTLFNVNYLDKGVALYNSLEKSSEEFELYVLAMDDQCYEILVKENKASLIPIKLSDFENDDLLRAKSNRSFGEYCWTCSSSLIKYVIDKFQPDHCTYIDADMYFYYDPVVLVKEMYDNNATVLVTGHRFNWYASDVAKTVGRFCVEFNTFANTETAYQLLCKWVAKCIDSCTRGNDGIHYGDQMYIDKWCDDYTFVYETKNLGAGVAPWNIFQYKLAKKSLEKSTISVKCKKEIYNLVFYHFENLQYFDRKTVDIAVYNAWNIDDNLINSLYIPYLEEVDKIKGYLQKKYDFMPLIKSHPAIGSDNKSKMSKLLDLLTHWQSTIMGSIPYKIYKKKNIIHIE